MRRALRLFLQLVGALTLLAVLAGVAVSIAALAVGSLSGLASVREHTVLTLDLETAPVETGPADPLSQLFVSPDVLTVRDIVDALETASGDDRVAGVWLTLGAEGGGLAVAQELRDALRAFRDEGKFAVASSETFGEYAAGNGAYYIAAACDEIYLQPSGDVGLNGLVFETQFLKGLFDKLEIEPQMDHRYEYKNAMNAYTETAYTVPHREAVETVMNSQFGQIVRGIAKGRGLEEQAVRQLVDRGPFLGEEAVDAKLVDGLAYRDEVRARLEERAGDGARFLSLATYLDRAGRPHHSGTTIALIYGVGGVARGESTYNPLTAEPVMGSDTVAAAFRAAIDDDAVKAIVFRVDSPGGSYVASDTIWRETVRARDAGKPVIVSMGNVAGSGGYFVAMAADTIVAEPGTITGSIGVLGGKLVTRDFMAEKLGITMDETHTSANSTMFLATQPYSASEWARHEAWLDRVYADFTSKVAEGRHLDPAEVRRIAKGRIWTGEDAKDLGLVDELGGFAVAVKAARAAADLEPDARINLRVYPRPRTLIEMILSPRQSVASSATVTGVGAAARDVQQAARAADELGLLGTEPDALTMPVVPVIP